MQGKEDYVYLSLFRPLSNPQMKNSIRLKGILLVSVPLLAELVLLICLGKILADADKTARRVDRYRGIISKTAFVQKQMMDGASMLCFYPLTRKPILLTRFDHDYASLVSTLSELTDISDGERTHRQALLQICTISNEMVELMDKTRLDLHDADFLGKLSKSRALDQLFQISNDYVTATNDLAEELQRTEQISPKDVENNTRMQFFCLGVGLAICISFILLSVLFYKQIAGRLSVLLSNTKRFAEGEKLLPELPGSDEIAQLDQVFHRMSESIEESNEFRKQIIATVGHELRTPLTSLQTFLELLAGEAYGTVSEEAINRSKLAKDQVKRLIRLLNDLLAAESLRAKGFSIQTSKIDIAKVVADAIASVSYLASRRNIELSGNLRSLEIEADSDRILQVLVNLLSNSLKFSPQKSEIKISCDIEEKQIRVKVSDMGRGVPPEMQEEIFNRHAQVKESDKSKKGGAGLGLAICKAIILQHGGQIGCYNNEDAGSTFWFTLPLMQEKKASVETGSGQME